MLKKHPAAALFASALLFGGVPASAELEQFATGANFLIATDHSSPEQIGPNVHHHHHHEPEGPRFELEVSAGVDSRYVSEGRDNLPGEGGIAWGGAVGHVHALGGSFFAEVLGVAAWDADYEETNLTFGFEFEQGSVTAGAAVTYLWFPADDTDDVEIAVFGEVALPGGFALGAEGVWSTEADGWFGEAQLAYEAEVAEWLTLVPAVFVGMNQNYVTDEHDGLNHIGARVEAAIPVVEHVELSLFAAALTPLDDQPGETLRDLFWGGGAITWTF